MEDLKFNQKNWHLYTGEKYTVEHPHFSSNYIGATVELPWTTRLEQRGISEQQVKPGASPDTHFVLNH